LYFYGPSIDASVKELLQESVQDLVKLLKLKSYYVGELKLQRDLLKELEEDDQREVS
jgi:hypothetical protein